MTARPYRRWENSSNAIPVSERNKQKRKAEKKRWKKGERDSERENKEKWQEKKWVTIFNFIVGKRVQWEVIQCACQTTARMSSHFSMKQRTQIFKHKCRRNNNSNKKNPNATHPLALSVISSAETTAHLPSELGARKGDNVTQRLATARDPIRTH